MLLYHRMPVMVRISIIAVNDVFNLKKSFIFKLNELKNDISERGGVLICL